MDKNQCFRFISELKEIQVKVMENQQYLELTQQDKKDDAYTAQEILNIVKYRWDNYLLVGNTNESYW